MTISAEFDLVAVSASAALVLGGSVRLFGARWLFACLRQVAGLAMRRRGVSTALLGITASAGLAAASAIGLQPPEFTNAVSWFHGQFSDVQAVAEHSEGVID